MDIRRSIHLMTVLRRLMFVRLKLYFTAKSLRFRGGREGLSILTLRLNYLFKTIFLLILNESLTEGAG